MPKVQKHLEKLSEHKWKKARQTYASNFLTKKPIGTPKSMDLIGEYIAENIYESDVNNTFREPKHPRIKE